MGKYRLILTITDNIAWFWRKYLCTAHIVFITILCSMTAIYRKYIRNCIDNLNSCSWENIKYVYMVAVKKHGSCNFWVGTVSQIQESKLKRIHNFSSIDIMIRLVFTLIKSSSKLRRKSMRL